MAGKLHVNYPSYLASTALNNKARVSSKEVRAYAEGYNFVRNGGLWTTPYAGPDPKCGVAWVQGCTDKHNALPPTHVGGP